MIFVLWGTYCYENIAATFVTEMRSVGLLAKVVGLGNRNLSGAHGLVLVPDLTLGQALPVAKRASCVILPCDGQTFQHFHNDPRLQQFFKEASANHAHFVVGEEQILESIQCTCLEPRREDCTEPRSEPCTDHHPEHRSIGKPPSLSASIYPSGQNLLPFAQSLARTLLNG